MQAAERDREAAERAKVADAAAAAAAAARLEEAREQAAAERARMAAELEAARQEIAALRTQVPPAPFLHSTDATAVTTLAAVAASSSRCLHVLCRQPGSQISDSKE